MIRYQGNYTEADTMKAWNIMLERYGGIWNVFALDIRNEPHGVASWGNDNPATDFNKFCERAIDELQAK